MPELRGTKPNISQIKNLPELKGTKPNIRPLDLFKYLQMEETNKQINQISSVKMFLFKYLLKGTV
jgi:hypothetical protein